MPTPLLRRLKNDRGAINFVNVFLVLALAAAGYYAWVYVPLYIEYFGVKKAVRTACNAAYASRNEDTVRKVIFNGVAEEKMVDREFAVDGSIIERPTPFSDQNFTVTLQQTPPSVTVEIAWDRQIVMPIFNKPKTVSFSWEHTEDLSEIKY